MGKSKKQRKKEILNLLKNSQVGMSIKNIAEELEYSRNTVSKYLNILEEEEKVFDRELGQYKIYLHSDAKLYFDKQKAKGQQFALETYRYFLEYLTQEHPELNREGKNAGLYMGQRMNIESLISSELLAFQTEDLSLKNIAKKVMDLLDNTYLSMDTYEFDPPYINEDPAFILLRMRDSQYINAPINFYMLAGVMEEKFNQFLEEFNISISVDVHAIHKQKRVVDLKLQIK